MEVQLLEGDERLNAIPHASESVLHELPAKCRVYKATCLAKRRADQEHLFELPISWAAICCVSIVDLHGSLSCDALAKEAQKIGQVPDRVEVDRDVLVVANIGRTSVTTGRVPFPTRPAYGLAFVVYGAISAGVIKGAAGNGSGSLPDRVIGALLRAISSHTALYAVLLDEDGAVTILADEGRDMKMLSP